jgi:hypothetical protein
MPMKNLWSENVSVLNPSPHINFSFVLPYLNHGRQRYDFKHGFDRRMWGQYARGLFLTGRDKIRFAVVRYWQYFSANPSATIGRGSITNVFNVRPEDILPDLPIPDVGHTAQTLCEDESTLGLIYGIPRFYDLLSSIVSIEPSDSYNQYRTNRLNPRWPSFLLFVIAFIFCAAGVFLLIIGPDSGHWLITFGLWLAGFILFWLAFILIHRGLFLLGE